MSDLIKRSDVEKAIEEYFKMIIDNTDDDVDCALDYSKNLCDTIKKIPTAYDADKVVEKMKCTADHYECEEQGREDVYMVDLDLAILIVKDGGMDE